MYINLVYVHFVTSQVQFEDNVHNFMGHMENVMTRKLTITLTSPFLPVDCVVKHHSVAEETLNLVSGISVAKFHVVNSLALNSFRFIWFF